MVMSKTFYLRYNINIMQEGLNIETHRNQILVSIEKVGDISIEQEKKAEGAVAKAVADLQKEYSLTSPVNIFVCLMSDEKFREGSKEGDPNSWKYCFLLRDQGDGRVYVNVDIFSVLPDGAQQIVKHELAHIVTGQMVGSIDTYKKSFILEEGVAGLDNATELLIAKLKNDKTLEIPNPLSITTLSLLKSLGGDTNVEPFTSQIGYLVLFSFVQLLKDRHGAGKIIEVYKKLSDETSLTDAYASVCGDDISKIAEEWKKQIEASQRI